MKCLLLFTTFYYLFDSCYGEYSPNADLPKSRLRPAKPPSLMQSPALTPSLNRKLYHTTPPTGTRFPTEAWTWKPTLTSSPIMYFNDDFWWSNWTYSSNWTWSDWAYSSNWTWSPTRRSVDLFNNLTWDDDAFNDHYKYYDVYDKWTPSPTSEFEPVATETRSYKPKKYAKSTWDDGVHDKWTPSPTSAFEPVATETRSYKPKKYANKKNKKVQKKGKKKLGKKKKGKKNVDKKKKDKKKNKKVKSKRAKRRQSKRREES